MTYESLITGTKPGKPSRISPANLSEHGLHNAYCILITGRCGSTLLTKLIKGIGLFGNPDEFFSEDYLPYLIRNAGCSEWPLVLNEAIKLGTMGRVFGFQIDAIRLRRINPFMGLESAICDTKTPLPCLYMRREDIIAQAYSYTIARKTSSWHDYAIDSRHKDSTGKDAFLATLTKSDIRMFCKDVMKDACLILQNEQYIENLLSKREHRVATLTYEQLISDRFYSVYRAVYGLQATREVLDACREQREKILSNPTLKSSYTQRESIFEAMHEHFGDIIDAINTCRSSILPELCKLIESTQ